MKDWYIFYHGHDHMKYKYHTLTEYKKEGKVHLDKETKKVRFRKEREGRSELSTEFGKLSITGAKRKMHANWSIPA